MPKRPSLIGFAVFLSTACGPDIGDTGESDSAGDDSLGGTSSGSSTKTDAATGPGEADAESGTAETRGDLPPLECHDAETIEGCESLGCAPWVGQQWFLAGEGWCLGVPELLGCEWPIACPFAEHVCDAETTWALGQGCIPFGMTECEPPIPDQVKNCND